MLKPVLSVIIKALNEEVNIAACIESVLNETKGFEAEIILVDSLSTDRTIDIAKQYPIKIVQFINPKDVCVGAAVQLGYQCASGDYLYLIDGDMKCVTGFIREAFNYLQKNHKVAGVGGLIIDQQVFTEADRKRIDRYNSITGIESVASLGGGGLYRRSAIECIGYFSHHVLMACEELELGVRLHSSGFTLKRLAVPSVFHTGHTESNGQMFLRLWSRGRLAAYTTFLKTTLGKPWFWLSLRECWFLFPVPISITLSFISFILYGFSEAIIAFFCFWIFSVVLLTLKKLSFKSAVWSFVSFWLLFFAAFHGIAANTVSPYRRLMFNEIDARK